MKIALKNVNVLPARTWNRLGINEADFCAEPAGTTKFGGETVSPLPEGVQRTEKPFPLEKLETGMGREAAKFVEKNRTCGVSLRVSAETKAEKPVILSYRLDDKNPEAVDLTEITAEENSEITVIQCYRSEEGIAGFHGGLTKLYAAKGAVIHLIQVQLLGGSCAHFSDVGAFAADDAAIDVVQAELGGKTALSGVKTQLDGFRSRLDMNSIYFGDSSRKIDLNYVVRHIGRKTKSEIHLGGALLDESQKTFRGTIDFVRGSKQAVGHESEFNLLFSPKVRNRTAPLILCEEEDVEGQHAASTGKIDANRLFYLMSRGLSEADARRLLIEAQFRPVISRIPNEEVKNEITKYMEARLSRIESMG